MFFLSYLRRRAAEFSLLPIALAMLLALRFCDLAPVPAAASMISKPESITAVVTVPSASILTLFSAPYQVIAAPGANKVIAIRTVYARLNFGTLAYVPGFGGTDLIYGGTSISATSGAFGSLIGAAATSVLGPNVGAGVGGVQTLPAAGAINAPVLLRKQTQEFTTGNGTLTLWFTYDVLNLN